jgi:hypothetical protein
LDSNASADRRCGTEDATDNDDDNDDDDDKEDVAFGIGNN